MSIPRGASLRGYDHKWVSDQERIDTGTETIVQQHMKEEVDINNIVRRFGLTYDLPAWRGEGMYGDFTGISDYESAVAKIRAVDDRFLAMPAEIRDRFKNDPAELVRWADSVTEAEFDAMMAPKAPVVEPVAPAIDPPE